MSTAIEPTFTMENKDERPPATGLSRDEHIAQFLSLDARIRELSYERQGHVSVLKEQAHSERTAQQKTVHLQATDGAMVQVEFQTAWECNSEELETAKELLKDEKFNEIFKTTYTPRLRAFKLFLNTGFSDEAWNVAKEIIKEHCREVDKTPYVQAEKSGGRK